MSKTSMSSVKNTIIKLLMKHPEDAKSGSEVIDDLRRIYKRLSLSDGTIRVLLSDMKKKQEIFRSKKGYYIKAQPAGPKKKKKIIIKHNAKKNTGQKLKKKSNLPEEKFRAIYCKYRSMEGCYYPFPIVHTRAKREYRGTNKWKYPDVISIKWELDSKTAVKNEKDKKSNKVLREYSIRSIELKVGKDFSQLRQHFFQCISNSYWANYSELAIASVIKKRELKDELKKLGSIFNINITCFGIKNLGRFPDLNDIYKMSQNDFKNEYGKFIKYEEIFRTDNKKEIDPYQWKYLSGRLVDIKKIKSWINRCIKNEKIEPYDEILNKFRKK